MLVRSKTHHFLEIYLAEYLYKFNKLNDLKTQIEYLERHLEKICHTNPNAKLSVKLEIRWREKILIAEDYDLERILKYVNGMKTIKEKIEYLLLLKKNINGQIKAHKQKEIFEYSNDSLQVDGLNSELAEFILNIRERFDDNNVLLQRNQSNDRFTRIKDIRGAIKIEITN